MNDAKTQLRVLARRRRAALARAAPDAAGRAAANLPQEALAGVRSVSVYRPMADEIDCGPLAERLAALGVRLLLPVVVKRREPLVFRSASEGLVPDGVGLPAPPPSAAEGEPDLVITPLLAFDGQGHRLGYGGGYYDRTLAALRSRRPVLVVGLAFEGQAVAAVPHDGHDQKLDAILTEIGYRRFPDKDR